MARVLAEILGASEPAFRMHIQRLEQAAGLPGADIRLMMQIVQETREKIRALGLDPADTTGAELYEALQVRLREDEARVRDTLGVLSAASTAELLEAIQRYVSRTLEQADVFAIKQSSLRAIFKKLQPKTTMKRLGYRSMDSMLKHEPMAQLLAATLMCESREWHRQRLEAYKRLTARDFETKKIAFFVPSGKRWPQLAQKYTAGNRQHTLALAEAGAVIFLPLEHDLPALAITTMLLAMQEVNAVRATSVYLKLHQVRADFGTVVYDSMQHEPLTHAEIAGRQLPWSMVHWFYGHGHSAYHPEAFEPHVQPEDLAWHTAESVLAGVHPALEFWEGSHMLAMLDGSQPVSLNMLDVALGVCNGLSYGERVVHHMRASLSRELLGRYLHQENLQALLATTLGRQLTPDTTELSW